MERVERRRVRARLGEHFVPGGMANRRLRGQHKLALGVGPLAVCVERLGPNAFKASTSATTGRSGVPVAAADPGLDFILHVDAVSSPTTTSALF